MKQRWIKSAQFHKSCHVCCERNRPTRLQGLQPSDCQRRHFHRILHRSKLPYQHQDLNAALKKPQSGLSDAQLKDVKPGFSYAVLVSAVSASNIILKRTHLGKKRNRPGSLTVMGRFGSPGVSGEDKRNGYMVRVVGGGGGVGRGTPTSPHGSLLGTWRPGRRNSSTQVSCSAGPSVQPGSGPNPLPVCLTAEMRRRHEVIERQMPTGETKSSCQARYCCCDSTAEVAFHLPVCFSPIDRQLLE